AERFQFEHEDVRFARGQPDAEIDRDDRTPRPLAVAKGQLQSARLQGDARITDSFGHHLLFQADLNQPLCEEDIDLLVREIHGPRVAFSLRTINEISEGGADLLRVLRAIRAGWNLSELVPLPFRPDQGADRAHKTPQQEKEKPERDEVRA